MNGFDHLMDGEWYLVAMNLVFDQCMNRRNEQVMAEAERDHDLGVAHERLAELRAEQAGILNSTILAVSSAPWQASVVDIEILSWVMGRIIWLDAAFSLGNKIADAYDANPTREEVAGVYLNLRVPGEEESVIKDFLARFPWSSEKCETDAAKAAAIRARAWEYLNGTTKQAERMRPSDEPIDLSSDYGRLILDYKPSMQFLDRHGWWPGLLWHEGIISWTNGSLEHRYDAVLPTAEEGSFLMARMLNQSRNLVRDDQTERLLEVMAFADWENEPAIAVAVLSLPSFRWTYGDLPCA